MTFISRNDSTIYKLLKDIEFVYSSEAAKKWLRLFSKMKNIKEEQ